MPGRTEPIPQALRSRCRLTCSFQLVIRWTADPPSPVWKAEPKLGPPHCIYAFAHVELLRCMSMHVLRVCLCRLCANRDGYTAFSTVCVRVWPCSAHQVDIIQSLNFCVAYVPIHNRLPESVLQDISLERYSPAPLTQKAAWVTSISITAPFCRTVKQMTCQIVVIRLLERDWFFNGVIYETIQTAEPHVQEAASS